VEAAGKRLRREDVLRHVERQESRREEPAAKHEPTPTPSAPAADEPRPPITAAPPGADAALEEVVPMSLIRRRIARRLVEAQQNAALLTTFNEIDMSNVMALRKEHGERFREKYEVKLGFMSFFVKAVIDALKQVPTVNAEIRGEQIVYRNYYHIGIAIGGAKGLVVPVLRHAERLSFAEVEQAIADFAKRADARKLEPQELEGGTFTISNGRHLRLAALHPDRQPTAERRARYARHSGTPGGPRRAGGHPAHDVRGPLLRSPPDRRPRSRDVPQANQGNDRRSARMLIEA